MRFAVTMGLVFCGTLAAGPVWADAVADGIVARDRGDYQRAIALLQGPARDGNARAELEFGLLYFLGHGVPQDGHEAARWFLAAARQGQKGALVNTGIAYVTGTGVPRNLVQAYMWFSLAVETGNAAATRYRDHVATEMTADDIAHAEKLTHQCKASGYKNCQSVQCLAGPIARTFGSSSWDVFACDDGRSLAFVAKPGSKSAPSDFTLSYSSDGSSALTWGIGDGSSSATARAEVGALTQPERAALFAGALATQRGRRNGNGGN